MPNIQILNSLRGRYFVVSIVLVISVITFASLSHVRFSATQQSTTINMGERKNLLVVSRHLRDETWQARQSIEKFLLNPLNKQNRQLIHTKIASAIVYTEQLIDGHWTHLANQMDVVTALQANFVALDKAAEQLISIRTDPALQYPTLALSIQNMLPNSQVFYTAATIAMDELLSERESAQFLETYQLFVKTRHLWTLMNSEYHFYVANQLGSFDEVSLPDQAKQTQQLHKELMMLMQLLQRLHEQDKLGVQSSKALSEMHQAASLWFTNFEEVVRIHEVGDWRTDTDFIEKNLDPLFSTIWQLLLSLDMVIESTAENDVKALASVGHYQTRILWLLTFVGVFFIALGYWVLGHSILRPIAQMVQALREEALQKANITLPKGGTLETQALVNAFTEMHKQVHTRQVALEHQALHDALTGLPNRNLLFSRMEQVIAEVRRDKGELALVIMDLNRFKEVNDSLGHQMGDKLLDQVGMRLCKSLREMDMVARLGGDEFAVLLPALNRHRAELVANKIVKVLNEAFYIDGHQLYIGVSIGIALYPQHGINAEGLIKRADMAMYMAKRNNLGYYLYDPQVYKNRESRLILTTDLHRALDDNALSLYYMPKQELSSGRVVGVEALLRWQHPKYGIVSPDQIIPLAEQNELIKPLTYWVMQTAIAQCERWRNRGLHLSVAINLSVYNLQSGEELISQLKDLLLRYNLPTHYITMEITEGAMMSNPSQAVETLQRLSCMGIKLSIDDFGTGFSSLAYLKRLPLEELKIDKSFVMDMMTDDNDAVIVRSTVDLAHQLGLSIVAEGVESKAIKDTLTELHCDTIQGYFLCEPLTVTKLEQWLVNQSVGFEKLQTTEKSPLSLVQ